MAPPTPRQPLARITTSPKTLIHRALMLVLVSALLVSACGRAPSGYTGRLQVHAAASLKETFEALKREFEATHPQARISLALAGSQVLRLQIEHGAQADVFASASASHMQQLLKAGLVAKSHVFARNELAVITGQDNSAKLESFSDLPRARLLVIGTQAVPNGSYTRTMLKQAANKLGDAFAASVLSKVVSEENNVRLVRAKVELGEADAAVVYRTDAMASKRVRTVPIPAQFNVAVDYQIGVVERGQDREMAEQWLAFVMSPQGRAIITQQGLLLP